MIYRQTNQKSFLLILAFLLPLSLGASISDADTSSDLQKKIDDNNSAIQSLNAQIQSYQKQIDSLGSQSTSLAQTIKSLNLTKLELETNIKIKEDEITAKNFEIQRLDSQISDKQASIFDDRRYVSQLFAKISQTPDDPFIVDILGSKSISNTFTSLDQLASLQKDIYSHISNLSDDRQKLVDNKTASEKARSDLVALQNDLSSQRKIVVSTAEEQKSLLSETNQSEAAYRRMLADKNSQMEALQEEIQSFESQLHLNIDSKLLPHTGSGVLSWPLDSIRITQYFGNTPFSTANPQIYNGKGHTGVDFAASIGTPVKAALSGQVIGIGNTDLFKGCYSFGKWIMIKHDDGLSTLYAHLSLQNVNPGDSVTTGQVIGYSGNTGYTTGPHLHFGVYATQGVELKLFSTSKNCKGAVIPVADYSAYLNPLSFL